MKSETFTMPVSGFQIIQKLNGKSGRTSFAEKILEPAITMTKCFDTNDRCQPTGSALDQAQTSLLASIEGTEWVVDVPPSSLRSIAALRCGIVSLPSDLDFNFFTLVLADRNFFPVELSNKTGLDSDWTTQLVHMLIT